MRAIVTCEGCGNRQAVARPIRHPETFHVICHGCEGVLMVEVTGVDLTVARMGSGDAGGSEPAASAAPSGWGWPDAGTSGWPRGVPGPRRG
jgi:ribosomal protein S27E